jgi:hypothetical protein
MDCVCTYRTCRSIVCPTPCRCGPARYPLRWVACKSGVVSESIEEEAAGPAGYWPLLLSEMLPGGHASSGVGKDKAKADPLRG